MAINSSNKALLTIMMSNNFVELKGSVFKKFDKNNLFQVIKIIFKIFYDTNFCISVWNLRSQNFGFEAQIIKLIRIKMC